MLMSGGGQQERVGNEWPTQGILIQLAVGQSDGVHSHSVQYIHPASRGVAAHTAGLFRSVRGAKGGVEYEEQSSTGELTYITAGFVNIFLIFTSPPRGGSPS